MQKSTAIPYGTATPTTQAFGDAPVVGTATKLSLEDHKHGMPTNDIGAKVTHTSDQTITGSGTMLAFGSESYDTDAIHHNSTNNSRLTCKTAGKYLVVGQANWAIGGSGNYVALAIVRGGDTANPLVKVKESGAVNPTQIVSTIINLAVNDYVELQALHDYSGTTSVRYLFAEASPYFMMQRIST